MVCLAFLLRVFFEWEGLAGPPKPAARAAFFGIGVACGVRPLMAACGGRGWVIRRMGDARIGMRSCALALLRSCPLALLRSCAIARLWIALTHHCRRAITLNSMTRLFHAFVRRVVVFIVLVVFFFLFVVLNRLRLLGQREGQDVFQAV
jgi:hypothetical protein